MIHLKYMSWNTCLACADHSPQRVANASYLCDTIFYYNSHVVFLTTIPKIKHKSTCTLDIASKQAAVFDVQANQFEWLTWHKLLRVALFNRPSHGLSISFLLMSLNMLCLCRVPVLTFLFYVRFWTSLAFKSYKFWSVLAVQLWSVVPSYPHSNRLISKDFFQKLI